MLSPAKTLFKIIINVYTDLSEFEKRDHFNESSDAVHTGTEENTGHIYRMTYLRSYLRTNIQTKLPSYSFM